MSNYDVARETLKHELPPRIKLFEIDLTTTNIGALNGTVYRLTPMQNNIAGVFITWGGNTYIPYVADITGIGENTVDAPPRPQLTLGNIKKDFGALVFQYGDLVGATVTFIETFAPYLGTTNKFSLPPRKWELAKKLTHNKNILVFELRDPKDKERAFMPKRQMLRTEFPGLGVNKRVR